MRKTCLLFMMLTVTLGVVFCCSCAPRAGIKNLGSRGKNIVCFGDSITAGEGVSEAQSYPAILGWLMNRPVINAGVSGETSAVGLERLEADVLSKDPFLVIVEFGGNDYLRQLPLSETIKNIEAIINGIHAAGSAAAICDISSGLVMSGYKKEFRKLAEKNGCIFIEGFYDDILANTDLKSDGIHPNDKGYELLAHRVYKKIGLYFRK